MASTGTSAVRIERWRAVALERGVLLRPRAPVVFVMPVSCSSDAEADAIVLALR